MFTHGVEECHGQEALDITSLVLAERPELLECTLANAYVMAVVVEELWTGFDRLLDDAPEPAAP